MILNPTFIKDLYIIEPEVHYDNRGYFFESYSQNKLNKFGLSIKWVQDNESRSHQGVVRGLHYQIGEMAQTKLVRVCQGKVLDVVVDIRKDSPTYGKHFSIILSSTNKRQLLVPKGFAHGFSTLSKEAIFQYKCDQFYSKELERGFHYASPSLDIDWHILPKDIVISEKDNQLKIFDQNIHRE